MTSEVKFKTTIGMIKTYNKNQVPNVNETDENGLEVRIIKKDRDGNVLLKRDGSPQTMIKIKKRGNGSLLQRIQHNVVKELTIHDLANEIRQYHSFRASEIDYNLLKGGAYTVTDSLFKSFQLLAVDVDHGNMSLDELKVLLNKHSLDNYALIYPTLSSSEENKRWRVVFVLDKPSTNSEHFKKMQAYLIYCLFEPYSSDLKKYKVDASCKNTSRLFFNSKNGEIAEEHNRVISFDTLLNKALERDYAKIIANWASEHSRLNGKEKPNSFKKKDAVFTAVNLPGFDVSDLLLDDETLKEIREREKGFLELFNDSNLLQHGIDSRKKVADDAKKEMANSLRIDAHYLTDELEKQIESFLMKYSYEIDSFWIDANESIEFINKIDLSELLGIELNNYIPCPFHAENKHDSAGIFKTNTGITLFNCFSCGTQHTTFHFLHELYHSKYGDNYFQTVKRILKIMDLELGSEYQRKAKEEINFSKNMIHKMSASNHEFIKKLSEKCLLGLLDKIIYDLADVTCPPFPLTKDAEKMKYATLFVSKEYIRKKCVENGLVGNLSLLSVQRNINLLVKYGLLIKLTDEEVKDEFLETSLKFRDKMIQKMSARNSQTAVRRIEYYAVPLLSREIVSEALDLIKKDEKTGMGSKKNMTLKVQALADSNKAKKTFVQDKAMYTKEELKFIKDAEKCITVLLDTAGYISVKNILQYIDPKRSVIKSAAKKQKIAKKFIPAICANLNLIQVQVTAETRKKIKLYEEYHYKEYIYIKD